MHFDLDKFKIRYPRFTQSDEYIEMIAEEAACLLSSCLIKKCGDMALFLAVAHLLQCELNNEQNPSGNAIASATIDKVSVSYAVNQSGGSTDELLGTPYGKRLLALKRQHCGMPSSVGGRRERSAFRAVAGKFPNNGQA